MTTAAFPTGKVPGQDALMECFFFFSDPKFDKGGVGIYTYTYKHTYIHPKKAGTIAAPRYFFLTLDAFLSSRSKSRSTLFTPSFHYAESPGDENVDVASDGRKRICSCKKSRCLLVD